MRGAQGSTPAGWKRERPMRVRDHVAFSTAGAALLLPKLGASVLVPWTASILIDADHILWFFVHERSVSPGAALKYFNGATPAQHAATRILHCPWVLGTVAVLGVGWRGARLLALGMIFHAALDGYHQARTAHARRVALRRDGYTCQRCGAHGTGVVAHLWRQPWLFPSYRTECLVSLCYTCHRDAHQDAQAQGIVHVGRGPLTS
jgi:hypothetical protein